MNTPIFDTLRDTRGFMCQTCIDNGWPGLGYCADCKMTLPGGDENMTYADTSILVKRALAEGYGLRVELDAGVFDLFGADLREEWDVLMPGEAFDVLGVVTEGVDDSIERDENMSTTAERIAELTAEFIDATDTDPDDYAALSEDDWAFGLWDHLTMTGS